MRLPTDMPKLEQYFGAFRVYCVYDFPPACHLRVGEDARRGVPAVAGRRDEGRLVIISPPGEARWP